MVEPSAPNLEKQRALGEGGIFCSLGQVCGEFDPALCIIVIGSMDREADEGHSLAKSLNLIVPRPPGILMVGSIGVCGVHDVGDMAQRVRGVPRSHQGFR